MDNPRVRQRSYLVHIFRFASVALVAAMLASAGCSGGLNVVPVTGTVKLNGQPLDKIQVEFWPIDKGPRSIGVTDAEGRFTLTTDGTQMGAVVGRHKVVLKDVGILGDQFLGRAGEDVDMAKGKKPRISNVYSDPSTTTVEKSVTSGSNQIDIDVVP